MFANLLAAPFVFGSLLVLYLAWSRDAEWAPWMIPLVLPAALIYIFAPQINWWYYARRPQKLSAPLRNLLQRYAIFYNRLDAAGKKRFEGRVTLFIMGVEWMPMGWPEETVPADVQLALAAQAVSLSWAMPDVLFEPFEQVVVYPAPFPSPEYPFAHASELYEPDGCLIFSAEQVMPAFTQPFNWYNVALHEYAKALVLRYPESAFPDADQPGVWEKLEQVSRMPREHVESIIGLAGVEPLPVMIHHYRVFPDAFAAVFPEEAEMLARLLDRIDVNAPPANRKSLGEPYRR